MTGLVALSYPKIPGGGRWIEIEKRAKADDERHATSEIAGAWELGPILRAKKPVGKSCKCVCSNRDLHVPTRRPQV